MRITFGAHELSIVGAGALARTVAWSMSNRVTVRLYSRRTRAQLDEVEVVPEHIDVAPLAALADGRGPVVLALATDEGAIIADARARGAAEVPRAAVAAANVALLQSTFPFAALARRAVLVVTNPVELIAELVAARAPSAHVIAFGMGTDRSRIAHVLTRGFGLPDPGRALAIGGLHWLRPIPALSALPDLAAAIAAAPPAAVAARLGAPDISTKLEASACPYDRLDACVRALTASEFVGSRPPLHRPGRELAGLLGRLLEIGREPEDVSAVAALPDGPACVGGTYDPPTGAFAPAALGEPEAPLFAAALAEHRAAVARLTGGPR